MVRLIKAVLISLILINVVQAGKPAKFKPIQIGSSKEHCINVFKSMGYYVSGSGKDLNYDVPFISFSKNGVYEDTVRIVYFDTYGGYAFCIPAVKYK